MPELPEMEHYRQLLETAFINKQINAVTINREKSINVPVDDFKKIENSKLIAIKRRAKHLLFYLSTNDVLVLHLMLGGWLYIGNEGDSPDRTKQIILRMDNKNLYFIGLRLGYLHLIPEQAVEERFSELGPEPLQNAFTYDSFLRMINRKKASLKSALVDQKFIAGIGNCYSDEICFSAALLPSRKINDLTKEEIKSLYKAIPYVLTRALQFGGYMDHPLYKEDQTTGGYEKHSFVYDKEGKACPRCHAGIQRGEISSRKSFYCTQCQT